MKSLDCLEVGQIASPLARWQDPMYILIACGLLNGIQTKIIRRIVRKKVVRTRRESYQRICLIPQKRNTIVPHPRRVKMLPVFTEWRITLTEFYDCIVVYGLLNNIQTKKMKKHRPENGKLLGAGYYY